MDLLGAPVAGAAHPLDPAALGHPVERHRHVRRRDVERLAELLLVHVAVVEDQHQDRELRRRQAEGSMCRVNTLRSSSAAREAA
jgi:hypothetical protein